MKPIRLRLSTAGPIIIVIALLIAFGVIGVITTQTGEKNISTAIKETSRPITTISAKLLFNPLYNLNVAGINDILSQYVDGRTIVYAAVYDTNAERLTEVAGTWTPDLAISTTLSQQAISLNAQRDQEVEQYLILVTPISVGDQVIGTVEFVFDQTAARSATGVAQVNIIITTSVALVLTALAFFLLIRAAVNPLSRLALAAQKIGSGDLTAPIQSSGAVEVASLANSLELMRSELQKSYASLEQRVQERTLELEQTTIRAENRAQQLSTISEIANTITSIQNLDDLLPTVARIVSERLGHYHVGIFLNDERNQYAVLRASNSPGGARMLNRGHKLKIGEVGLVGYVTKNGIPRIALDVGNDAVFFNNPDLPDTRSAITLPLNVGSATIGALDVQSMQPAAFTEDDVNLLGTLTSQVAIAIENARSFLKTTQALAEAEHIYQEYVKGEWQKTTRDREILGYRISGRHLEPLGENDQPAGEGTFAVPVTVRGEKIGVIGMRSMNPGDAISPDEMTIMRETAERVSLAIESARLFEETQKRATRERSVAEMSAKIGASIDIDAIMKSTVEEVGRLVGDSEVAILIGGNSSMSAKR